MKKIAKRTAAAALAGVMAAGMLSGCGEEALDGTKTVATVDGEEIPLGIVSLLARQQQAQTEEMYRSFLGGTSTEIWDTEADEETGETYGEQAVSQIMEQVELMYIFKTKAGDYEVEVTEEDEAAIAEAAAAFMEANDEETLETLAVNEEQVKTLLELETYQERMYTAITESAEVEVTDEEAEQSSFTYVSISTSGDDLTEDDIAEKKEQAQEILDQMKEDPTADMSEVASAVDETYSALEGTFDKNVSEDAEEDEESTSSSAYPDEVIEVLRGLGEGEMCEDVIETDTSYYVVRMDEEVDEDATESKKESLISEREEEFYTETTDGWLEEADIEVNEKVLKTLTITDSHTFSFKEAEVDDTEEVIEDEDLDDATAEDADAEEGTDESAAEDADTEETTEADDSTTEEAETTPEATAAPTATSAPTATPKATSTPAPTSAPTATPKATSTPTPTSKPTATP